MVFPFFKIKKVILALKAARGFPKNLSSLELYNKLSEASTSVEHLSTLIFYLFLVKLATLNPYRKMT